MKKLRKLIISVTEKIFIMQSSIPFYLSQAITSPSRSSFVLYLAHHFEELEVYGTITLHVPTIEKAKRITVALYP